jgi:hypothetical protein
MILNGATTTPTSTFPYHAIGPVDFSGQNFVKTEQTDFYYSESGTLMSEVKQTYNPVVSFFTVLIVGILCVIFVCYTAYKISKRYKI